jgi:hypothetical protein
MMVHVRFVHPLCGLVLAYYIRRIAALFYADSDASGYQIVGKRFIVLWLGKSSPYPHTIQELL